MERTPSSAWAGARTLFRALRSDGLRLRAMALTYISLFALVPAVLLSCALFAALYLFVPATRVRPYAALAGGVVAGIAWELAKALYTFAVSRFFRYHAIYGS